MASKNNNNQNKQWGVLEIPGTPNQRVPVRGSTFIIGRSSENCHYAFESNGLVSGKHLQLSTNFEKDPSGKLLCYVADLGSTNGTLLNKTKLKKDEKHLLSDNDFIELSVSKNAAGPKMTFHLLVEENVTPVKKRARTDGEEEEEDAHAKLREENKELRREKKNLDDQLFAMNTTLSTLETDKKNLELDHARMMDDLKSGNERLRLLMEERDKLKSDFESAKATWVKKHEAAEELAKETSELCEVEKKKALEEVKKWQQENETAKAKISQRDLVEERLNEEKVEKQKQIESHVAQIQTLEAELRKEKKENEEMKSDILKMKKEMDSLMVVRQQDELLLKSQAEKIRQSETALAELGVCFKKEKDELGAVNKKMLACLEEIAQVKNEKKSFEEEVRKQANELGELENKNRTFVEEIKKKNTEYNTLRKSFDEVKKELLVKQAELLEKNQAEVSLNATLLGEVQQIHTTLSSALMQTESILKERKTAKTVVSHTQTASAWVEGMVDDSRKSEETAEERAPPTQSQMPSDVMMHDRMMTQEM